MMEIYCKAIVVLAFCVTRVLTCTPPAQSQMKTMSERVTLSEIVLYGTVNTITPSGPFGDQDVNLTVTCILKITDGLSVGDTEVIQDRSSACPTTHNNVIAGNAYIFQIINVTGGRFQFKTVNSQAAYYSATQENLDLVVNLNGFENPRVPPGGDIIRCPKRMMTMTGSPASQPSTTPSKRVNNGSNTLKGGPLLALIIFSMSFNLI